MRFCQVVSLQIWGANRNSDKWSHWFLRLECNLASCRCCTCNNRERSGKELAQMLSRHHTGHWCDCVFMSVCINVYVHTGSNIREEMGRNGLKKRESKKNDLWHSWNQRKSRACVPRKRGTSFPSIDILGLSSFSSEEVEQWLRQCLCHCSSLRDGKEKCEMPEKSVPLP